MNGGRPAYELLPVIDRIRDAEQGQPLGALLELVERELRRLDDDVDGLHDNWFIETCAEWVVPYIGDLLGVPGLRPVPSGVASQRAVVANTIRYRRRKGTAAVLEQLARDVTGWPARVVEYFQLLATTQHLDHVRLSSARTTDLRAGDHLELVHTPFDTSAHTADVRHIDVGRGRYNIPNIGIHLWRLGAYVVSGVDARAVDAANGRWTFDPAGRDVPLFNRPVTETDVTHLAEEANVPGPVRRRGLDAELARRRAAPTQPGPVPPPGPRARCLPPPPPEDTAASLPLAVRLDQPVPDRSLVCCNLNDWHRPSGDAMVAVDPVLGRLTVAAGLAPARVRVDFAYGFPGDIGAGPYDRREAVETALASSGVPWPTVDWQVGVSRDAEPGPGRIVPTISDALRLWDTRTTAGPGQVGVIAVMDSATYRENLTITIPAGDRLLLVAAGWPARTDPDQNGVPVRDPGTYVASGQRPHLIGTVMVAGETGLPGATTELVLDGLSVEGSITAGAGDLTSLVVANTTVLGDAAGTLADGGWITAAENPGLTVRLLRTVCAGIRLPDAPGVSLTDSLLYAGGGDAVLDAPVAQTDVEACTVLGRTRARTLTASNAILTGPVDVSRRQHGCVRFSYLPLDSVTPRRYRCQPANATAARSVAPSFTSVRPADPGFGQLAGNCPAEIVTGADDEGELGAYHFLQQHRRVANLLAQLDHYLRFGLEAGLFFTT